jgi:hypothetical protein
MNGGLETGDRAGRLPDCARIGFSGSPTRGETANAAAGCGHSTWLMK